ncbi:hypothetical protein GNI_140890 [Gregarina niphandrodes]|uniref:Tetratricopeptide repeat protein n=1 Tax=Gregarina niphandrodes TaxID=110365 RepID=A0A023B0A4_GRENI|nr:hypothetical protein GNI_140890 [Gregarina niphandrodes]EZG45081.1 hypothetical protein GNI_140890 [Gregarina niphandrodes]|eukprot:XP_011132567.1 hypothetical protein GNI_140890 [Gregarina niphandrodes]
MDPTGQVPEDGFHTAASTPTASTNSKGANSKGASPTGAVVPELLEQALSKLQEIPAVEQAAKLSDEDLKSLIASQLQLVPPNVKTAMSYAIVLLRRDLADFRRWELLGEAISLLPDDFRLEWEDTAFACFLKSLELGNSPTACWYLGQACEGEEARDFYLRGKTELEQRCQTYPDSQELRTQLADVYTALAELYMTDLCFEPDAEARCIQYLEDGNRCKPNHFPLLVQQCSYYTVTMKLEEAKDIAQKLYQCLQRYYLLYKDSPEGSPEHDADRGNTSSMDAQSLEGSVETLNLEDMPDFEAQLTVARIMTDIGMHKQAIDVLLFLHEMNDEDDRTWHRLAIAYMLDNQVEFAHNCVSRALTLRQRCSVKNEDALAKGEMSIEDELKALKKEIESRKELSS